MTSRITVDVTADDIAAAMTKDSSRCAVATAIARQVPGATRIAVDVQAIRFTDAKGQRLTYLTPPMVAGYVVAFDAGEHLVPFRFQLRADQRMVHKRLARTDAGRAKDAARDKVRQRRAAAGRVAADPGATPAQRQVAIERVVSAEQERDAVMAAYAGQVTSYTADADAAPPIPKVFKRKERTYGMRQLRINQARPEVG